MKCTVKYKSKNKHCSSIGLAISPLISAEAFLVTFRNVGRGGGGRGRGVRVRLEAYF